MSAEKDVKSKPKWRKPVLIALFVLLNVAVIVATATMEFGNSKTAAELSEVSIDWWLLIPAVICFVVATIANIYKYVIAMRVSYKADKLPDARTIWKHAWRVVMLGKYYDNVTPAAVGGQPFQIYYMYKNTKLSHGKAAAIPIVGMITTQIGFLAIAIVCFLFGSLAEDQPALIVMAWLGLLVYAFWPVMVAGISYFPKPTIRFLRFLVKILAKLRIIKNRELILAKVETEVMSYAKATKTIMKTPGMFTKQFVLSVIYNGLVSAIPFFVLTAFGSDVGFWESFGTTLAVTSAVYFVPTPGNSGAAEGTFFLVFSALSTGYVFWAMLIWRFFSYYIYIILGPVIYFFMHLEKRRGKELSGKQKTKIA